jgi:ferritin-like protein
MARSAGLHEPEARLTADTIDRHRALVSIQEELEAVDWYAQRVDGTDDADLAGVLARNRDEEKEHAAMTLECIRRHDPVLDRHLRTYLFTSGSILEAEAEAEAAGVLPLAELRADFAGRLRLARRREHVPLPRRDLHLPRCDARGRGRTLVTGYCPTGRRGHGSRPTMRR